jgi:hypothetical protein
MDVSFIEDIATLDFITGANPVVAEGRTITGKVWQMGLLDGVATLTIDGELVSKTHLPYESRRGFFSSTTEAEMVLQELFDSYVKIV